MASKRGPFARERSVAVIPRRLQKRGLREVWVVWSAFALAAFAVFETYWRIPPSELWKVHNSGFVGGAGRAFVFLSFSAAVAAVAALAIVVDRLDDRRSHVAGVVAGLLCATVAIPGVQTESHLDPKWANLPAVLGVLLAVGLTALAQLRGRTEAVRTTRAGDVARLAVGAVALFFALPYIAAELGFFLDDVPVLSSIFITGKVVPEPGAGYAHAAVHHGHHHGLDGFLLALTALLFSRLLGGIRRRVLQTVTAGYLSLMLVYGLTNEAEDVWIEQVVKRGWTGWQIPNLLHPSASAGWAAMIAVAALFYAAFLGRRPLLRRA
jgi:hypothetical protein